MYFNVLKNGKISTVKAGKHAEYLLAGGGGRCRYMSYLHVCDHIQSAESFIFSSLIYYLLLRDLTVPDLFDWIKN